MYGKHSFFSCTEITSHLTACLFFAQTSKSWSLQHHFYITKNLNSRLINNVEKVGAFDMIVPEFEIKYFEKIHSIKKNGGASLVMQEGIICC